MRREIKKMQKAGAVPFGERENGKATGNSCHALRIGSKARGDEPRLVVGECANDTEAFNVSKSGNAWLQSVTLKTAVSLSLEQRSS